jgi:hypothetical protein
VSADDVSAGAAVVAADVPAGAAVVAAALVPPDADVLAVLFLSLPQAVAMSVSAASDAKT